MAMASRSASRTTSRTRVNSAADGRSKTRPSESVLSLTPNRISRPTSGAIRSKKKSYNRGRACRPISITSSNPDVVISPTRAPFRCSRALVPTVVPCSSVSETPVSLTSWFVLFVASPIFRRASAIARDGSSGVENTFRVLSSPSSIHTQSVNVPPVSIAMRLNARVARTLLSAAFNTDVNSGRSAE